MKNVALLGTPSLTEGAYQRLRDDLLKCRIKPGEKLKLNELALRLGVNLSAVRESLSRLSSEGLVTLEAQRGFRAAPVSLSDLRDLTHTRIQIETSCLSSAIKHGDVEWEAGIVASFHRLTHTSEFEMQSGQEEANPAWNLAHAEFHASLVAACESSWLLRIRSMLFTQSLRYRCLSVPLRLAVDRQEYLARQDSEHRRLMEATLARDIDAFGETIAKHFSHTADLVQIFAEDMKPAE